MSVGPLEVAASMNIASSMPALAPRGHASGAPSKVESHRGSWLGRTLQASNERAVGIELLELARLTVVVGHELHDVL
ncbi:MAG TPA: hypothetical protein VJV78_15805 [Polyangiales bacterium]|nr:hypothetical protein [Polyangiales bacterium]